MVQRYNESSADLKVLMTAAPISPEIHAERLRRHVAARRLMEDRREEMTILLDELLHPVSESHLDPENEKRTSS